MGLFRGGRIIASLLFFLVVIRGGMCFGDPRRRTRTHAHARGAQSAAAAAAYGLISGSRQIRSDWTVSWPPLCPLSLGLGRIFAKENPS
jgi:hypothetical protein